MTYIGITIDEVCALRRRVYEIKAELAATRAERDSLADALWCAEDQWGEDYLWEKWGLSKALTQERKDALIDLRPNAKADLAPASGAQVQRLVGQTELAEG